MQKFDVCVVGGGASGSVLAILLAQKNVNVCVVDKFDAPAKKLLVTGNGKCNITNKNMSSKFYNQNIDDFLNKFGYEQTIKTFASFGLDVYADEECRCYPASNSAKTVQFVLINQFKKYDIDYFAEEVANISFDRKQNAYVVKTVNQKIIADKIVLACGINNFSLDVCKKFDVDVVDCKPSLVALKTKQNTKALDGKRLSNVLVKATCGDESRTEVGEVLFKSAGLSGICIFNLSAFFAKNKNFSGKIAINLLKNCQKDDIFGKIYEKVNIFATVQELLESMFVKEIALEILKQSGVEKNELSAMLNKIDIEKIVDSITNLTFDVCGFYDNNQVVSGGVSLKQLSPNLESIKNRGMYFCGEICDIDGICGGYNLQWAWTSAFVVSQSILNKWYITKLSIKKRSFERFLFVYT